MEIVNDSPKSKISTFADPDLKFRHYDKRWKTKYP